MSVDSEPPHWQPEAASESGCVLCIKFHRHIIGFVDSFIALLDLSQRVDSNATIYIRIGVISDEIFDNKTSPDKSFSSESAPHPPRPRGGPYTVSILVFSILMNYLYSNG